MADLFTQQISHPVKKAAPRTSLIGEIGRDAIIEKRTFTDAERKQLADKGAAMAGGRYPITQPVDVSNAVKDYNRTGQDPAVKAHIISRAKAIGATGNLPDDWITKYNENHDGQGRFSSSDSSGGKSGKLASQNREPLFGPKSKPMTNGSKTGPWGIDRNDSKGASTALQSHTDNMKNGSKTGPWPIDKN